MRIIGNGILVTRNDDFPLILNGAVVIKDNLIIDYGETSEVLEMYQGDFYDAGGKIIMPGLINAHHHIYSAFARGMNLESPKANNFNDILNNLWWKVDKTLNLRDVEYSAYATFIESIKNGVTTVFDHHASQGAVEGSLFKLAEVAEKLGVRTSLCYEVSDRDGPDVCKQAIKENIDFIKYANEKSDMLTGMFGIHASFTVSDETLATCVETMEGLDAGYHIHTAEDAFDQKDSIEKYGKRVVERLNDFGIANEKSILVHSIHVDDKEIDILGKTKSIVVHNPESNMGNAVGRTPIFKLLDKGVLLGLGTDGFTSDMFESLKVANLIHKHDLKDSNVAWAESANMLFDANKEIANRFFERKVGVIEDNAYADIIVVDYNPITPLTEDNINSHILFGMMGRSVVTTMIDGKYVMVDRIIQNVDEDKVMEKSREISNRFWGRVK